MDDFTKDELEFMHKSFTEARFTPGSSPAMLLAESILDKIAVKLKNLQSEPEPRPK